MTPEGKVKYAIKKWLIERGVWYFMPVQNGMGMMGVPDFIICWKGRLFAVECKAPGKRNTVTALQERNINAINQQGGLAVVVTSIEEFISAIPL